MNVHLDMQRLHRAWIRHAIAVARLLVWTVGVCGIPSVLLAGAVTGSEDDVPRTPPQNLQVLPKDISPAKLGKVMKRIGADLGVKCSHCHAENPQTQKADYASDDKPQKQTARIMMTMLSEINEKYLSQLGTDRRYSTPVTCGSCHQGQSTPPAFESRW